MLPSSPQLHFDQGDAIDAAAGQYKVAFHHTAVLVFESRNADGAGPFDWRSRSGTSEALFPEEVQSFPDNFFARLEADSASS